MLYGYRTFADIHPDPPKAGGADVKTPLLLPHSPSLSLPLPFSFPSTDASSADDAAVWGRWLVTMTTELTTRAPPPLMIIDYRRGHENKWGSMREALLAVR